MLKLANGDLFVFDKPEVLGSFMRESFDQLDTDEQFRFFEEALGFRDQAGFWTDKDGHTYCVNDMDDVHLRSSLRRLVKNGYSHHPKFRELRAVAKRRGLRWKYQVLGSYFGT